MRRHQGTPPDTDIRLRSAAEAVSFLGPMWRDTGRGPLLLVPIDDDDGPHEVVALHGAGDNDVPAVLMGTTARLRPVGSVRRLLLVTDRTGERPVMRDGDELRWQEWSALMDGRGWRLVDWLVRVDCYVFSVAEFAPTATGW